MKRKNETDQIKGKDLADALNTLYAEVMIADNRGVIIQVSDDCGENYGMEAKELIGCSVYDLEKKEVFCPSIIAKVIESGEMTTMPQETQTGQRIVVTAVPIFDATGKLEKIISYSRNLTEYIKLRKGYEELRVRVGEYSQKLQMIRNGKRSTAKIKGNSKHITDIKQTIETIAPFDANVLITGESGVGKSMFAQLIHEQSNRRKQPFIAVNCNAIPETLIESELFGYVKGAFTGADEKGKSGIIEQADKGTLFLDEIGELPLSVQSKLLNVIQDKMVTKIGSSRANRIDFRLISATNTDLEKAVEKGTFRTDLYYRLNVIPIKVAPVRERREDIFFIVSDLIEKYNKLHHRLKSITGEAMECLIQYDWPGNVREIQNVTERLIILSKGDKITKKDLPHLIRAERNGGTKEFSSLKAAVEFTEKEMMAETYARCKSVTGTAEALSISQATATRKLHKYGIIH